MATVKASELNSIITSTMEASSSFVPEGTYGCIDNGTVERKSKNGQTYKLAVLKLQDSDKKYTYNLQLWGNVLKMLADDKGKLIIGTGDSVTVTKVNDILSYSLDKSTNKKDLFDGSILPK